LVVLGLDSTEASAVGRYVGTGMHGGFIYVRGTLEPYQVGAEVGISNLNDADWAGLSGILAEFCHDLGPVDADLKRGDFTKLTPQSTRPYGTLYAY